MSSRSTATSGSTSRWSPSWSDLPDSSSHGSRLNRRDAAATGACRGAQGMTLKCRRTLAPTIEEPHGRRASRAPATCGRDLPGRSAGSSGRQLDRGDVADDDDRAPGVRLDRPPSSPTTRSPFLGRPTRRRAPARSSRPSQPSSSSGQPSRASSSVRPSHAPKAALLEARLQDPGAGARDRSATGWAVSTVRRSGDAMIAPICSEVVQPPPPPLPGPACARPRIRSDLGPPPHPVRRTDARSCAR